MKGAVMSVRELIFTGLQSGIMLERYEKWCAGGQLAR